MRFKIYALKRLRVTYPIMDDQQNILVEFQDIAVIRDQQQILSDINLSILPQQILTLIGPNGAGKSTLVKVLLGLIAPTHGRVVRHQSLKIGYMPQKLSITDALPLTVKRFLDLSKAKAKLDCQQTLSLVHAEHLLSRPLQSISGGEFQRVLLARALLAEPNLLVLDEPVQGVDMKGQAELYQLIKSINARLACAVVMVSHDLHLVMAATDQVICMNGHICCRGAPDQISNDPSYLALMGNAPSIAPTIAPYRHHHNHHHNLSGDVITPRPNDKHSE